MSTIAKSFKIDGTLTNMTSVVLSDPTGTYGVRRTDTSATVVADGTAMTNTATGVYSHEFVDPADDITYEYYLEVTYGGETYWITGSFDSPTTESTQLVTLTAVKEYLGVTGTAEDSRLNSLITYVSGRITEECDVTFITEDFTERYDGNGTDTLILDHFPIIKIDKLSIGEMAVMTIVNESSDALEAFVKIDSTGIVLTIEGGANDGVDTISLDTYTTLGTVVTAINAVGKDWTATISISDYDDYPSEHLITDATNFHCLDSSITLYFPSTPLSDYIVYPNRGWIQYDWKFPKGNRNIYIEYNAGYASIPSALQFATVELIAWAYKNSKRDPTLRSERLGDHSWAAGEGGAQEFEMLLHDRLSPFKNWSVVSV